MLDDSSEDAYLQEHTLRFLIVMAGSWGGWENFY